MTQIGGNDLDKEAASVETVSSEYTLMVVEMTEKFPETNIIVSGLPPRFKNEEIRTKVKDLNEFLKKWAAENKIQFIGNEESFELRCGDVDRSAYVMTGDMPRVHLNRQGTVRLLENMKKHVNGIQLSQRLHETNNQKRSYAQVAANTPNTSNIDGWETRQKRPYQRPQQGQRQRKHPQRDYVTSRPNDWNSPRCYFCGENNHSSETCRFDARIQCFSCKKYGHKIKTLF